MFTALLSAIVVIALMVGRLSRPALSSGIPAPAPTPAERDSTPAWRRALARSL